MGLEQSLSYNIPLIGSLNTLTSSTSRLTCEFSAKWFFDKPFGSVVFICWHKNIKFCQKGDALIAYN